MVKIVRPLFATDARGKLRGAGIFRLTPTGHVLQSPYTHTDPATAAQLAERDLFRRLYAEWLALDPATRPPWPEYWWEHGHPPRAPVGLLYHTGAALHNGARNHG